MFEPEEQKYIDPPPRRKDIPEHPFVTLGRDFFFQLRKREVIVVMEEVKKCSNCYWCQSSQYGPHTGCYSRGQWRKWIPKKKLDIPNECLDWKAKGQEK